ncbi:MAG: amino acid permease [Humidesulfovibrio sp.]|uniref:amino acid permease n=1 Tax=Humidesulfovibrio sp. TaxID=2910988 RepID=UPI0027ECF653|nr:amino acid permease [Humidesulfovibrio sp.]MDQ7836514.1 amino acid permease [Humidesulfovibrio sp.]
MDTARKGFGTFGGVFTPCTLTILGVIMFLRLGEVVGQSGFVNALIILFTAKAITLLTTASLAAISTNTRIKGGGAYFMISRSLGVEYGTAIGVFFFLAQAISAAMYIIGFTEAFFQIFPWFPASTLAVATAINAITFVCVFIGAGWTIKVQYLILAALVLSILSFVAGAGQEASMQTLLANANAGYVGGESFFSMFALFFPAVTGIMAGANMSGDLRDPARAIPGGTFAAIGFTGVVYFLMILLLAAANPRPELILNSMVIRENALWPLLITVGIFSATLSSALGSMMGAPRILQSIARDGVSPWLKPLARISGGEPRHATVLTFVIAQGAVMAGNLNTIAPVITMFFMITYGTLNLACFYEAYSRNPSFRPSFRLYSWGTALAGSLSCLVVMFLINALWALVSICAMGLLFWAVSRAEIEARWGDVSSGVALERVRTALLALEDERYHPKNWRPIILALSTTSWTRTNLAQYAYWLAAGRGILSLGQVLHGEIESKMDVKARAERMLRKYIAEEELEAFPVVVVEAGLEEGLKALLQCHGIGGIKPNTLVIGLKEAAQSPADFFMTISHALFFQKNVVCVRQNEGLARWSAHGTEIALCWEGARDGVLMLLFAHLMKLNKEWRNHEISVLCRATPQTDRANLLEKMQGILELARVNAKIAIEDEADCSKEQRAARPGLTILSMPRPAGKPEEYVQTLLKRVEGLGDTILIASAGHVTLDS